MGALIVRDLLFGVYGFLGPYERIPPQDSGVMGLRVGLRVPVTGFRIPFGLIHSRFTQTKRDD